MDGVQKGGEKMSDSRTRPKREKKIYHNEDELPKFMSMHDAADVLRISSASAYTLSQEEGFPVILFNCQRRVRRERFMEWLKKKEHITWQTIQRM